MDFFVGLDPGGDGQFGWAVSSSTNGGLLCLVDSGISSHAEQCVGKVLDVVADSAAIRAAGIDSPMYWTPSCTRSADLKVRRAIALAGSRTPGGTVQHPNSLRGACVVQGPVSAMLLRRRLPFLPITESHPKAMLLCLTGQADTNYLTRGCATEHARDAALGSLAAWAMFTQPAGWSDLVMGETDVLNIISLPVVGYWFPLAAS